MAQTILGLDIGSHSVKAVRLDSSFNHLEVKKYNEALIPTDDGETPWEKRVASAVKVLLDDEEFQAEVLITAMPCAKVTSRIETLPFSDPRRIEQVLYLQLEGNLPFPDLADVIIGYQIAELLPDGGARILVLASPKETVKALLDALAEVGVDPKILSVQGLGKATLLSYLFKETGPGKGKNKDKETSRSTGPVAVVDIGHRYTTVSVVAGNLTLLWRSLPFGGKQVTAALAKAFGISTEQAESGKLKAGMVADPADYLPGMGADQIKVCETLANAFRPLIRDLRQSFMTVDGVYGADVEQVFLVGGTARLPGLTDFLKNRLSLPVSLLDLRPLFLAKDGGKESGEPVFDDEQLDSGTGEQAQINSHLGAAEAMSMALRHFPQGRLQRIDMRKEELAYKGDFQYLRGKVFSMAVAAIAVLMGLGTFAYSKFHVLRAEERVLVADLMARTEVILGRPTTDFETAARIISRKGAGQDSGFQFPSISAYDIMFEISNRVGEEVTLDMDVMEVDVERKRVELRGRTDSATSVERIVENLSKYRCFEHIERDRNEKGTDGRQLFVLSIRTECQ